MKTIWKYQLGEVENILSIPKESQILSFQIQNNIPCIWVLVDSKREKEKRIFTIYGTGVEITEEYISFV